MLVMKFFITSTLLLAIFQLICASSISELATGTASGFFAPLGSLADQITAVGDPEPLTRYFNSGGFAPQYLELELPCFYTVHNIFLQVEFQSRTSTPNVGYTLHKLYAGPTTIPTKLVATLDGNTTHAEWIHINFSPPLSNVRFLRLNTVSSESWVAWRKFLIF